MKTKWNFLMALALQAALVDGSGRRRSVPGASPFMIGCLFAALWAASSVMESAAVEVPTKIFWFKFQTVCQLPTITAITCFILEYFPFAVGCHRLQDAPALLLSGRHALAV